MSRMIDGVLIAAPVLLLAAVVLSVKFITIQVMFDWVCK